MPSRANVSMNRAEVNGVPLSGQNEIRFSTPGGQVIEHRLFHGSQRFFRSAAMRTIPAHDFSSTAVCTICHFSPCSSTYAWFPAHAASCLEA
jgi:hypothetical protein